MKRFFVVSVLIFVFLFSGNVFSLEQGSIGISQSESIVSAGESGTQETAKLVTPAPSGQTLHVVVGTVDGVRGGRITVPIILEYVPETGILASSFSLNFDNKYLSVEGIYPGELIEDERDFTSYFNNIYTKYGFASIAFEGNDSRKIKSSGVFAEIVFNVSEDAEVDYIFSLIHNPDRSSVYATSQEEVEKVNYRNGSIKAVNLLIPTPTPSGNEFKVNVGKVNGVRGNRITVPIMLENVPETGILASSFSLNFDNKNLSVAGIYPGELIEDEKDFTGYFNNTYEEYGFASIAFEGDESRKIKSNGVFATIVFNMSDDAELDEVFDLIHNPDRSSVYATSQEEIEKVNYDNGSITVADVLIPTPAPFNVNVGKVNGVKGNKISVPIMLENVPETGILASSFSLNFDNNNLAVEGIYPGELIEDEKDFTSYFNNTYTKYGFASVAFEGDESRKIKSGGVFATIVFSVSESAELDEIFDLIHNPDRSSVYATSQEEIKEVNYNSGSIKVVDVQIPTPTPFKVNVGELNGVRGNKIAVPIKFENVPQTGVLACSFSLNFDNKSISVEGIYPGELIEDEKDFTSYFNNTYTKYGFASMAFEGDEDRKIKSDGVFATIIFNIPDGAELDKVLDLIYNLNRTSVYATSQEEITDVTYNSGLIKIVDVPASTPAQINTGEI